MRLNELSLVAAAAGIRAKEFSVVELVSDCLSAIERKNKELGAYLEVLADRAVTQATRADEHIADGHPVPPLFGLPIALKDNILLEGVRCTAGSRVLESYTASYDATVVRKLKDQGAIFLGKTNLDEFAMGSSTEHSAFGPTKNPHDVSRVPGGSSGGSASAVAAHLCLAALGSDTGGSIRQPASFCGIVGFKPSYGSVSRHGLIAMASSLDQIGPMTKTVADAEILWRAIAGRDELDSTSTDVPFEQEMETMPDLHLKGKTIGIPKEFMGAGLDSDVKKNIMAALKKCESQGAVLREISLPRSVYALSTYYIVVPSEVSANLARYDGVRYGSKVEGQTLEESYRQTRARGFGAEVKRRIMLGTYVLSAGYYDAYYLKAQKVRRLISEEFERAFTGVDIIAGPTTPTPAFLLGERADNPLQMYLADMYTVAVNLAGLPAISMPAGTVMREGANLPVGLQFIAPRTKDAGLLGIARAVEILLQTQPAELARG